MNNKRLNEIRAYYDAIFELDHLDMFSATDKLKRMFFQRYAKELIDNVDSLKKELENVTCKSDKKMENIMGLIAEIRDKYLDIEIINMRFGYDITSEAVSCPISSLLYIRAYIELLQERVQNLEKANKSNYWRAHNFEKQNKRYREAIEDIKNTWKVTDTHQEYMDAVHDIIDDLEGEK